MSQGSCFYFQRLGWVTRSGGNGGSARGCERTWGRGWGHPERPLERWADCGHQLLSHITLIKCPEEKRPWKHPFLTTTPKISLPVSVPTCISLPAVASPLWLLTATKDPGHGDTITAELPDWCNSSLGLSCLPASFNSLSALILSTLEGSYGLSHGRLVPRLYYSGHPHRDRPGSG